MFILAFAFSDLILSLACFFLFVSSWAFAETDSVPFAETDAVPPTFARTNGVPTSALRAAAPPKTFVADIPTSFNASVRVAKSKFKK